MHYLLAAYLAFNTTPKLRKPRYKLPVRRKF